jgi:hypothetical protein
VKPWRKRSANRCRLCHPDGIAAGPRSPVEGPGRRGPGSRDAHQSKGLVTSVPGEPPRDGRGHRRRVGTAATPAIRTDVDPVAGAPAPQAPSRPARLAARPRPAMTLGPEPHDAASADSRAWCLPSPAPTSCARGARRAPAPGSGPHRPTGSGPPRAAVWPPLSVPPPGRRAAAHTNRSDGDENFYIGPHPTVIPVREYRSGRRIQGGCPSYWGSCSLTTCVPSLYAACARR